LEVEASGSNCIVEEDPAITRYLIPFTFCETCAAKRRIKVISAVIYPNYNVTLCILKEDKIIFTLEVSRYYRVIASNNSLSTSGSLDVVHLVPSTD